MSYTLFHYLHCPFCVRVRMTLGYLGISYDSQVLPYDDEATPLKLTGKKMLPILKVNDKAMNESLDIIDLIDSGNKLKTKQTTSSESFLVLEKKLSEIGSLVHSLAMPYWIWTPEFNENSRQYFQKKKEVKRGPFSELVKKQSSFMKEIDPLLLELEQQLSPFYQSNHFTLNDILIAAHVWGLYLVPEFQFSPKVHQYLQNVKKECRFNYYPDVWS